MKIKLENSKTFYLPDNIEPKERLIEVNKLLNTIIELDGVEMTVEEYFNVTWNVEVNGVNRTKNTLDRLGTYLSKMPNQNGRHDRYVLSRNDVLEMYKGVRWKTVKGKREVVRARYRLFTDLSLEEKIETGIIDEDIKP